MRRQRVQMFLEAMIEAVYGTRRNWVLATGLVEVEWTCRSAQRRWPARHRAGVASK